MTPIGKPLRIERSWVAVRLPGGIVQFTKYEQDDEGHSRACDGFEITALGWCDLIATLAVSSFGPRDLRGLRHTIERIHLGDGTE